MIISIHSILPLVNHTQSACIFIYNCYLKSIYCHRLSYFTPLNLLIIYKRLSASVLLAVAVPRYCSSHIFFCFRYRWPPIHKTRFPALSSITALHICPLFRALKNVFCIFVFSVFYAFSIITYIVSDSGFEFYCKWFVLNLTYSPYAHVIFDSFILYNSIYCLLVLLI